MKNNKIFEPKLSKRDLDILKKESNNYDNPDFSSLSKNFKELLYKEFKINLETKEPLLLTSYTSILREMSFSIKRLGKWEYNFYYDVILVINSNIASFMMGKIMSFVRNEIKTNSKNILYGDHKEKWGSIVGHITTNRKDKAIRIINYVKSIRKKYPFISSSYTISLVDCELEKHKLKGLNNYETIYQFTWEKKKRRSISKNYYNNSKYYQKNKLEKRKQEILDSRKKTIKSHIRLTWRDNLK